MVHEQKFKDLSRTCQISPERIVLDLESEVNQGPGFFLICNPNLHNIAISDRIGLKTKNPNVTAKVHYLCMMVFLETRRPYSGTLREQPHI